MHSEVAADSASYDPHGKLAAYRCNGVLEFFVWRVFDEMLDWFILKNDAYQPLAGNDDSVIRSTVFPGLWLDAPALLRRDRVTVLKCVQPGVDTDDHREFVKRLTN